MEPDHPGFEFYAPHFLVGTLQRQMEQRAESLRKQEEAERQAEYERGLHAHFVREYVSRTTDRWALFAQTHIDMTDLLKARGMAHNHESCLYDWHDTEDRYEDVNGIIETANDGSAQVEITDSDDPDILCKPSTTAHAKLHQMTARLDAIARFRTTYPAGSRIYAPRAPTHKTGKKMARRLRDAATNPRHPDHAKVCAELGPVALYWAFNIGEKP